MMKFGNILREKRTERKWSRRVMAEKLGISQSAIYDWEMREQLPNIYTCIDIADLFGCTLDELVGRKV